MPEGLGRAVAAAASAWSVPLVVGGDLASLTLAALLAQAGSRVRLLAHGASEATPSLASLRSVGGCGPGGPVAAFLHRVGLDETIRPRPLDPDGYEHVVIGDRRLRVPCGMAARHARLAGAFPAEAPAIGRYFRLLVAARADTAWGPLRIPGIVFDEEHEEVTFGAVCDRLELSDAVRAALAGTSGDFAFPASEASFRDHAARVCSRDRGAWALDRGALAEALVRFVRSRPGSYVETEREPWGIRTEEGRVTGVATRDGTSFRTIATACTRETAMRLFFGAARSRVPQTLVLRMSLAGIDLRAHGFGAFDVWAYPHADLDRVHVAQIENGDLSDPFLFLSTPAAPGAPATELVAATRFGLREPDYAIERVLAAIERRFVPRLRDHVTTMVASVTPIGGDEYRFNSAHQRLYYLDRGPGWPSAGDEILAGLPLLPRFLATQ
jgi:phytoene dehydrogenase-like protein